MNKVVCLLLASQLGALLCAGLSNATRPTNGTSAANWTQPDAESVATNNTNTNTNTSTSSSPSEPVSPPAGDNALVPEAPPEALVPLNRSKANASASVYPADGRPSAPSTGPVTNMSHCPSECNGRGIACYGSAAGGVCRCKPGFSGEACQRWVGCAQQAFCSGHGQCACDMEGCRCECAFGWFGPDCSTPIGSKCPNHCSGRGVCRLEDFTCECEPGFTGVDCGRVVPHLCENDCSGQGSCNMATKTCQCVAAATTPDCSRIGGACQSCRHGTCSSDITSTTCDCELGFDGPNCEVYTSSKDACYTLGFCSGHGVCVVGEDDSPSCACQPGFTGPTCSQVAEPSTTDAEAPGCVNQCSGNGRCSTLDNACECDPGFVGVDCGRSACQTSASDPVCSGQGLCVAGTDGAFACECDACFQGADCSEPATDLCASKCNFHGDCKCQANPAAASDPAQPRSLGVCECHTGWDGPECQYNTDSADCCPLSCSGKGTCVDCQCQCFDGWSGNDCATSTAATDIVEEDDGLDVLANLLQVSEGPRAAAAPHKSMAGLWD